ncbi:MAG TPA: C25 family cysteine peptidase, partial [Bacteroidales bacterium]|nr:C25 family cysteine peptidase [Bacteroidales bacterium]
TQELTKINYDKDITHNISVIKSSLDELIVHFEINTYNLEKVQTSEGLAFIVNAPNGGRIYEKGAPDLPLLSTSLIIDDNGMYSAEIVQGDYIELEDINIAPSKGSLLRSVNPNDVPYTYGEAYQKDEFYPETNGKLSKPFILRDFRGINLQVFPYTYNPISKVLRIYTSLEVKLTKTNKTNDINSISRTKSLDLINGSFNEIYESVFLNYQTNPVKYTPLEEPSPGNILIISHPEYTESMTDYITWKIEKGFEVEIIDVTEIGNTATAISAYVDNYFNDNGLSYLLLVGDAQHIPPMIVNSNDSDNAYAYVLGDDGYADFFVGRFSGESLNDIETQVARTVYYEKDMDETNSWLENALSSASNEGGGSTGHDGGESDEVHMSYINDDLETYGYSVTNVNQDGGNNTMLSNAVNEGIGIANYIGHGSDQSWVNTNFTNSNVNALTNHNKLLFAFSVACVNGNFSGQTCFAEAWLRATNNGEPTGAVGFLASTINQAWNEPMTGQDEMVDILIESYNHNIKR